MRILAIDPFHGGSHRQFLRGLRDLSRHHWEFVCGKPVHWKWRMRSAPLELASVAETVVETTGCPDLLFCTDMLDLPAFRGLIRGSFIANLPTVVYFHESQWSYPVSPHARTDTHFAYTNLLSALAADRCWFNSQFHLDDFLTASERFVQRMPDGQSAHDFDSLRGRCEVLSPGFHPQSMNRLLKASTTITIGWVSRWEHDKRPDLFFALLERLEERDIDFELVLLGPRPRRACSDLERIQTRFAEQIFHNGYAQTAEQYWDLLARMDVVVSTADHEFFGIAVCEAIWAGAVPVLPDRLSYPEIAIEECLYQTLNHASELISQLQDIDRRNRLVQLSRAKISTLTADRTTQAIDNALQDLVPISRGTI